MTAYTMTGHLIGMLDRDQRTAKFPLAHQTCHLIEQNVLTCKCSAENRTIFSGKTTTSSLHNSCNIRKNWLFRISLPRLRQSLLIGFYLSCVTFPTSFSAPGYRTMDDFMNHEPKWINPCGFPNNDNPSSSDGPTIDPRDSLKRIILQANIALTGAQGFKHDFADKTFHSDFESMIDAYKDSKFDWLPTEEQVPKNLGENLPDEFLANLEIDSFLVNSYEYLQKLAVAMEQIVEDKKKGNEPFGPNFVKSEADLRNLLCEIRLAIDSRKIERKPDVTRDIMSDQYRQYGSTTDRNMRHFLIYRDFINILEFVVQSFSHLINQNILK